MGVDWMLCMYALGALLVGVLIFRDDLLDPTFVKKEGERLGPSYWGVYQGNSVEDTASEKTIT